MRGEFLKAQRPSVAASAASSAEVRGELATPSGHGMGLTADWLTGMKKEGCRRHARIGTVFPG